MSLATGGGSSTASMGSGVTESQFSAVQKAAAANVRLSSAGAGIKRGGNSMSGAA